MLVVVLVLWKADLMADQKDASTAEMLVYKKVGTMVALMVLQMVDWLATTMVGWRVEQLDEHLVVQMVVHSAWSWVVRWDCEMVVK